MADPFDVQPPQWLTNIVGRPVDMTTAGAAIGNFARQKLRGPTIEQKYSMLQRSRMQKELEVMDSRVATETANELIKTDLIRKRTTGEIEFTQWLAKYGKDPESLNNAPINEFTSAHGAALALEAQKGASQAMAKNAMTKLDATDTANLAVLVKSGDPESAKQARIIQERLRENNGRWDPTASTLLSTAIGDLNDRTTKDKQAAIMEREKAKGGLALEIAGLRSETAKELAGIKAEFQSESEAQKHLNKLAEIEQKHLNDLAMIGPENEAAIRLVNERTRSAIDTANENFRLRKELEAMKRSSRIETPTPEGGKLVQTLTAEEAGNMSTLSSDQIAELQTYQDDKKKMASGDARDWAGRSREKRMAATKLKYEALGYDVETGKKIKSSSSQFKTAEDVRAAFRSGTIDRESAKKILSEQFNMK